jgi:MoaA/NifB/PqqE/SkfB family radical SAM enzyme
MNKIAQFARMIRSTARAKKLDTVIFFVTSRCNAACETCFYHAELNKKGDLTFEEIEKISLSMPEITDLWLSGGEPTLRKDLNKIIDLFVRNNRINRLIIPTNALVKARVFETVEHALSHEQITDLYLNVALDGYGETHDKIRGVPRNWQKTLDCIEHLYPLKEKFGARFRLNVNTVICAENYTEIEKLSEFLWLNFKLDGQYFNIIRGETKSGASIKAVPAEALPEIYKHAAGLTKRYGERMFAGDDFSRRFVKLVAYVGTIMTHYRHQHANFNKPAAWAFPCTAGATTAVIDYNGDVRACELREKFATLRDFDFDFQRLWADNLRNAELEAIDEGRACWCTHVCFIHDSLRHSQKALLTQVPKNYLTRENWT